MADSLSSTDTTERKFLGFVYPEVKGLAKHFLTLIAAVLTFTVTFSEKIVGFSSADDGHRRILIIAWSLFILAIVCTGSAIFANYMGATAALRGSERELRRMHRVSYLLLDGAGVGFVVGLFLLALCAADLRAGDRSPAQGETGTVGSATP